MKMMMLRLGALAAGGLGLLVLAGPAAAMTCDRSAASQPLPVRNNPVPALHSSLQGRPIALAAPHTLLAASRDESLALDVVLMRLRLEACEAEPVNEFADYVPETEFDNRPYRFNLEKGQKFTAAEFDAWMKSRGVRIVRARPADGESTAAARQTGAASTGQTVAD